MLLGEAASPGLEEGEMRPSAGPQPGFLWILLPLLAHQTWAGVGGEQGFLREDGPAHQAG